MRGMNAITGEALEDIAHLKQSITNILTTPIGSRVMRRDYGSNLFNRIDNPLTGNLIAEIYADVVEALDKWEPRFKLLQVIVQTLQAGSITLDVDGLYLGDNKVIILTDIAIERNQSINASPDDK